MKIGTVKVYMEVESKKLKDIKKYITVEFRPQSDH